MGFSVTMNNITVDEEELDVYSSLELKNVLLHSLESGMDIIKLDLSRVKSISTPGAQVILSAGRTFKQLDIIGGLEPSLKEDIRNLGLGAIIIPRMT